MPTLWPAVIFPRATGGRHTGWCFLFWFLFPSRGFGRWCFQRQQSLQAARQGFSRIILCCIHAFRPGECVGKPVSSQARHRKQFGITPTSRLPAGRLRESRVTPFIVLRSVARHFPLANSICLVGRAGTGGQPFQPSVLKRGGEVFTARC